jgi:hypothetical protein
MPPLSELLGRPVDPRPLAMTRIGVGIAAGMIGVETRRILMDIAAPGDIRVPVVGWMPSLDESLIWLTLAVWTVLAVALTLGVWGRAAAAGLTLVVAFVLLLDQQVYSNHLALLGVLTALLALGQPSAAWSFDAAVRGRGLRAVPYWPTLLIKVQISTLYGFAGLSKLNGDFLSGDVLRDYVRIAGVPDWLFVAGAIAAPAVELFIAGALWSRRLRPVAVVVGIGFHLLLIAVLANPEPLVAFAILAISGYPAFLVEGRTAAPFSLRGRAPGAGRSPAGRGTAGVRL